MEPEADFNALFLYLYPFIKRVVIVKLYVNPTVTELASFQKGTERT